MPRSARVVRRTPTRIEVLFEGFLPEEVNAIRRLALSDVPSLAVDFIYVYDNSSSVYDEIIAHRLGMLVLDSREALRRLRSPEECKNASEQDKECYVELILESEVAENAATGRYVTAGEIRIDSPLTSVMYPETPITYLAPGQRIHLVAYARLGRGREHGKWSPATVASAQYVPIVEYDASKASKECIDCVRAYPSIAEALESGGKGRIELVGNVNTSGLRYCAENVCGDALRLSYDDSRIVLTVETTRALPPERIVLEAVNQLERRASELRRRVEEALG